jgi:hypothetical protein
MLVAVVIDSSRRKSQKKRKGFQPIRMRNDNVLDQSGAKGCASVALFLHSRSAEDLFASRVLDIQFISTHRSSPKIGTYKPTCSFDRPKDLSSVFIHL